MTGGDLLGRNTASGSAAIRQRARATRRCARTTWRCARATQRAVRAAGIESRYNFCIVIGGGDNTVCVRARQGRRGATTKPSERHDMAPNARCASGLGAMRAQRACSQGPLGVHPVHST